MDKKYLVVANWKMYLSHAQECAWLDAHTPQLAAHAHKHSIVLCPSFVSLAQAHTHLTHTHIKLGAQECCAHATGPYTGQISAQSLQECGCTFCIIGHSEQRIREIPYDVIARTHELFAHNITPIICISEPTEHFIASVRKILKNTNAQIIIAYEPLAAIGTGNVASAQHVHAVLQKLSQELVPAKNVSLLYGGSINGKNCAAFKKIPELAGFLIGKASTDIDQLCAIITIL